MAHSELAWSTRGFCGYTNIGEGSACEATDRKGHWEVGGYITPSGFLYACLSMCKKCERCNYISVSHKAADCSWYHSCELQGSKHVELVRHSYQVRQHGAVVGRVERLLQRHVQNTSFESEGIRLVSMSPAAVCFGAQCVSWAAAGAASRGPGGWVSALPSRVSVEAQASCGIRNDCRPQQTCGSCIDEAATKGAVFDRTLALQAKQTRLITQHTLKAWSERDAKLNRRYKKGLVSTLTQSLCAAAAHRPHAFDLHAVSRALGTASEINGSRAPKPGRAHCTLVHQHPCSSARYEDGLVIRSFFSAADGRVLRDGRFLEMGAFDGAAESTTWALEGCHGWRGVLIEAMPSLFTRVIAQPRATLNLRLAACASHGWVNFTDFGGDVTFSKMVTSMADLQAGSLMAASMVSVQCGPIGDYLEQLGVHRLDFVSLDIEGAERIALDGLGLERGRLSLGVILVEVRADGVRAQVLELLLSRGLTYVGQVHGRPSLGNEVIDDVYINETHLGIYFPESRWFTTPAP